METVAAPAVLVSHLGYDADAPKAAVLVGPRSPQRLIVQRLDADGEAVLPLDGALHAERVAGWPGEYRRVDLSGIREPGRYRLVADGIASAPFAIAADRITGLVVSDITAMFRAQRSSGEIDRKDATAHFYGDDSGRTVDARGGWLDASGDYSKFLSHLTYTRMMSPQQIPLCAWALLTAARELLLSVLAGDRDLLRDAEDLPEIQVAR